MLYFGQFFFAYCVIISYIPFSFITAIKEEKGSDFVQSWLSDLFKPFINDFINNHYNLRSFTQQPYEKDSKLQERQQSEEEQSKHQQQKPIEKSDPREQQQERQSDNPSHSSNDQSDKPQTTTHQLPTQQSSNHLFTLPEKPQLAPHQLLNQQLSNSQFVLPEKPQLAPHQLIEAGEIPNEQSESSSPQQFQQPLSTPSTSQTQTQTQTSSHVKAKPDKNPNSLQSQQNYINTLKSNATYNSNRPMSLYGLDLGNIIPVYENLEAKPSFKPNWPPPLPSLNDDSLIEVLSHRSLSPPLNILQDPEVRFCFVELLYFY